MAGAVSGSGGKAAIQAVKPISGFAGLAFALVILLLLYLSGKKLNAGTFIALAILAGIGFVIAPVAWVIGAIVVLVIVLMNGKTIIANTVKWFPQNSKPAKKGS